MNELRCTQIININPGLSPYPQFIIRIWQQITTKNRFTTLIDSQQVTHLPRVDSTHSHLPSQNQYTNNYSFLELFW